MTVLEPALINDFALGLTTMFSQAAKGADASAQRFLRRRPYERILAGFLTPSGDPDEVHIGGEAHDESYEVSGLGLEWCLPLKDGTAAGSLEVSLSLSCFVRTLPTFEEAKENARFRHGLWKVWEAWERVSLSPRESPTIQATIELPELCARGASVVPLGADVQRLWQAAAATVRDLYPTMTSLSLGEADLATEAAYSAWIARQGRAGGEAPWAPLLDIRLFPSPTEAGAARVLLRIVNASEKVDNAIAAYRDPRLYGVELTVTIPQQAHAATVFRALPDSYRYDRAVPAVGINCQPRVEAKSGSLKMRTETVPIRSNPRLIPRESTSGPPRFVDLSKADCGERVLRGILEDMERYDATEWHTKLGALRIPIEQADAVRDRERFQEEIAKYRRGVNLLAEGGAIARAFSLMNETMERMGRGRARPFDKWHLFQIVFIVSALPSIVAEPRGEGTEADSLALLWFAAGGGKTEAFLGLVLWQAFYDRLRGKVFGTSAFVRYPLRLLTYQQLQRVCRALGKAEIVRKEAGLAGSPFSVGYLVGESTTPNKITNEKHQQLQAGVPPEWQRVFACPTCDRRSVAMRYNAPLRLIEHYCVNPECSDRGRRIPLFICDDDLYRYLPTVIVSTVDKLAGVGQNRRFSQLFGKIDMRCPRHGAAFMGSNRDLCEASAARGRGQHVSHCGEEEVLLGPFQHLGPSIHIQDELHLLREGLATFDSHYETAAQALQARLSESGRRWRLIGSTATIEGYGTQARHLYLTEAVRFPSPGPEAYESFYYTVDRQWLGRIYAGVLGVGRTHTPSVARTIGLLHSVLEGIRREAAIDPLAACQRIGMPATTTEALLNLVFQYEVILTYVLTRKGGDQVGEAIDTRVRSEVEDIGAARLRMESFNSSVDMPRMINTMEEIESASPSIPLAERIRGVVATNIISHGVDIDRFNMMVFAGLPRQFAEYIQASARVGRQLPGISVLVVTPQAARDRSVLDRFDKCHEYVDRLVEPVPINRWSEPALALTLRGVIVAYLMGVVPAFVRREVYLVRHVRENFGQPGFEALSEESVIQWAREAVGSLHPAAPPGFDDVVRRLTSRLYGSISGASPDHDNAPLNTHLEAMRSLRDIDDPGYIHVSNDDAVLLRQMGL